MDPIRIDVGLAGNDRHYTLVIAAGLSATLPQLLEAHGIGRRRLKLPVSREVTRESF